MRISMLTLVLLGSLMVLLCSGCGGVTCSDICDACNGNDDCKDDCKDDYYDGSADCRDALRDFADCVDEKGCDSDCDDEALAVIAECDFDLDS